MGQKITITLDIDGEYADPGDSTGVTEDVFVKLNDALREFGDVIEIRAGS